MLDISELGPKPLSERLPKISKLKLQVPNSKSETAAESVWLWHLFQTVKQDLLLNLWVQSLVK